VGTQTILVFYTYGIVEPKLNIGLEKIGQGGTVSTLGRKNSVNEPLVDPNQIIFPPLHVKLGLMKQSVKALGNDGDFFRYIRATFSGLSDEKVKAAIFDGPQIRKLLKDPSFVASMNEIEKSACKAFAAVVKNFLGNNKAENYRDIVKGLIFRFHHLGCNMGI